MYISPVPTLIFITFVIFKLDFAFTFSHVVERYS